jgi:TolA-binding protein
MLFTHSPQRTPRAQSKFGSACFAISAVSVFLAVAATPGAAQSREQRQMMADLRMLQEQNQTLQNVLGSIVEAIKAVNARMDDQARVTSKAMADQKLVIDSVTNTVREIREKLDDNNVRLGSLNQEVEALRQGVQQLNIRPAFPETTTSEAGIAPGDASGPGGIDAGTAPAPVPVPPPVALGTSPQKLYDEAYADYTLAQWDLAVVGFEAVIKYYPKSERAADAQVYIGHSYFQGGKNDKAVEAYDLAIRNYPGAPALPEAYYKKGVALRALKRPDEARAQFEYVVKTYPESSASSLARQGLAQLGPPAPPAPPARKN